MALGALRSRVLLAATNAVSTQLQAALPGLLRPLHEATEQLNTDVMDSIRANFQSISSAYPRIQGNLDHAKMESGVGVGDLHSPVVQAAGAETIAMLDNVFNAQLTAATNSIYEALMDKLQQLIFQVVIDAHLFPPTPPSN
jgi:hypothetical protein